MRINREVKFSLGDEVYLHGQHHAIVVGYVVGMELVLYQVRYFIGESFQVVDVEAFELSSEKSY